MSCKISISSCFDYSIPLNEQMKYIADAGFTHLSLGSNLNHSKLFEDRQPEIIKNSLIDNNLSIDTIHFAKSLTAKNSIPLMERTIQIANELNCPVIVAHCTSFMGDEIQSKNDIDKLKLLVYDLEILCKKYNIKIALENLCPGKATDTLEQILDITNSDYIGFCYDSSHDQIDGPRPMTLLNNWKHRLMALHISDRIKPFTDHVIIGEGFIDFNEMANILKSTEIEFPFLIEVAKTYSQYNDTKIFLQNAYLSAYDILSKIS